MSASCPVCLATNTAYFGQGTDWLFGTTEEKFSLHTCVDCRCVFIEPMPNSEKIASFYPLNYWWDEAETGLLRRLEVKYRRIILLDQISFIAYAARQVSSSFGNSPRILDVGCGSAIVLALLKARGFIVEGLDVSFEASEIARRNHGIDVRVGTLDSEAFDNSKFDMVVLLHTLEHLPNPHRVLGQVRKLLRPAGRLVLQVPNVDSVQSRVFGVRWYGLDVPRHLIDYSRTSLFRLLDANGFEVERVRNFNLRDNAQALASSLFPSLDPIRRDARRRSAALERGLGTWFRHLGYVAVVIASFLPAMAEAAIGRGATLMVQARKR